MSVPARTRIGRLTAVTALAGAALIAPAVATPALAEDTDTSCVVTGGDMIWGVKEAFRSYVSGTIANGSWEAADGATYETPNFTFTGASGEIDAETGEGSIGFAGSVHFTGHDGVLDVTFANPTIKLLGDGTARLLLDSKSNDQEGQLAVDAQQTSFGKIDAVGELDATSGALDVSDAPTVLTADGAEAFSGFYSSGEALDPISFSVQLAPCSAAAPETPAETDDEPIMTTQEAPDDASAEFPWVPVVIGAVAVVVIAVAAGLLAAGRKKRPSEDAASE